MKEENKTEEDTQSKGGIVLQLVTKNSNKMTVQIQVKGTKEVRRFLKKKHKRVFLKQKKGLTNAALFMQGEVKSSIAGRRPEPTSVDTGRFLNSVDFVVGKDDAVIFSDIPYAKFLEFGTIFMEPRRHFRNSKSRNKAKAISLIEGQIRKI